MRCEGYEVAVSRPEVLTREQDERREKPMEEVVVDVPAEHVGTVIERLSRRKGNLTEMQEQGGRTRLHFTIPTRGLIGFRTEFLSATRGEGVLDHRAAGRGPWQGPIPMAPLRWTLQPGQRSGLAVASSGYPLIVQHTNVAGPDWVAVRNPAPARQTLVAGQGIEATRLRIRIRSS